jgi:hypothetical protein
MSPPPGPRIPDRSRWPTYASGDHGAALAFHLEGLFELEYPGLEYPDRFEVSDVSANGGIRWNRRWVNVSLCCAGEYVGLEEIDDGVWNVYLGPLKRGRLLPMCSSEVQLAPVRHWGPQYHARVPNVVCDQGQRQRRVLGDVGEPIIERFEGHHSSGDCISNTGSAIGSHIGW